jgi:RNA polymerase sigma-70 factor (ECF subfamily)
MKRARRLSEKQLLEVFSRLQEEHGPRVSAAIRRWAPMAADPESAEQDAWKKVWLDLKKKGHPPENAGVWLWLIAKNAAIDHVRADKGRMDMQDRWAEEVKRRPPRDEVADRERDKSAQMRTEALKAAFASLDKVDALILKQFFFEGQTCEQIATMLEMSLSTLKRRKAEALKRVETYLEKLPCQILPDDLP